MLNSLLKFMQNFARIAEISTKVTGGLLLCSPCRFARISTQQKWTTRRVWTPCFNECYRNRTQIF